MIEEPVLWCVVKQLCGSYQLGTLAFSVGTAVWGAQAYAETGALDLAALAYGVGCLYFVNDAYRPLAALAGPIGRWASGAYSYRAGAVAYALGTIVWGLESYAATGALDAAASLYGIGCLYFLADAFGARRGVWWLPLTGAQLGNLAFLAGTIAWAFTGGVSVPVAAYGLGCLLFVRDAFSVRASAPQGQAAAPSAPCG